ncbi:hypothetical protein [Actimicrobium antarcticum]|uniref:Uncharacterized protein n=1 Tax=Actimicrobium antarcticum TaxID=1051899 RepID=A0ABP7T3W3_9BURK
MKTLSFAPPVDHFSVPSLALLAKKFSAILPLTPVVTGARGLALADIADISLRTTAKHGLTVSRRLRLAADL